MGAVVLAVAGIFLAFALSQSDLGVVKGYMLSASFANIGGLTSGSDVRINGIKVGTVIAQSIDQTSFNAQIKMSISPAVQLPKDTVAAIGLTVIVLATRVGVARASAMTQRMKASAPPPAPR